MSIFDEEDFKYGQLDNYCIFLASMWLDTIEDHINLIQVCKRLRFNMEKFHYNPIPLTDEIIEFFPNIETQYRYSQLDDYYLCNTKDVFLEYNEFLNFFTPEQLQCIEQWTGKQCSEVIFSSSDGWSTKFYCSFFDNVRYKNNLLIVITDSTGETFGFYLDRYLKDYWYDQKNKWIDESFYFNLNSTWRFSEPMIYTMTSTNEGYWNCCYAENDFPLFCFKDMCVYKKEKANQSCFYKNDENFHYHGIEYPLCTSQPDNEGCQYFTPVSIIVIQMN